MAAPAATDRPVGDFQLSPSQKHAWDAIMSGTGNYVLTGAPGTGKTALMAKLRVALSAAGVVNEVLAPTGAAAYLAGGRTIHASIAPLPTHKNITHNKEDLAVCLWRLKQGRVGHADPERMAQRLLFWQRMQLLIVDEVREGEPSGPPKPPLGRT